MFEGTVEFLIVCLHIYRISGYVGIWVTNDPRYTSFVLNRLFPKWGCEYITPWYWLKIAANKEPVIPFGNDYRKPYEVLLIGRYTSPLKSKDHADIPAESTTIASKETVTREEEMLPLKRVIVSRPAANRHSSKPPCDALFKGIVPDDAPCLELFARDLRKNYLSVGLEVYKFAHKGYFDTK